MLHPLLSRQCRMNDRKLHNHHLAHSVSLDTMFASEVSRKGNRCAQAYVTDFRWARAFPMATRSKAHETF